LLLFPRDIVEIVELGAKRSKRSVEVALDRSSGLAELVRRLFDRESFQVDENEHFALAAREAIERVRKPALECRVGQHRRRRVGGIVIAPDGVPAVPNSTPPPIFPRLVDENAIEPSGQACVIPKSVEPSISLVEGILGDVFGCCVIASDQSPSYPYCAVLMGVDKSEESLLSFNTRRLKSQRSDNHFQPRALTHS
jgi:hypothetical protein